MKTISNRILSKSIEEIEQLSQDHYKKAMKHMNKFNQYEALRKQKAIEKEQEINNQCTFKPQTFTKVYQRTHLHPNIISERQLTRSKDSKEQAKPKKAKETKPKQSDISSNINRMWKWNHSKNSNHNTKVIKQEIKVIQHSKSRQKSHDKSYSQLFTQKKKSHNTSFHQTFYPGKKGSFQSTTLNTARTGSKVPTADGLNARNKGETSHYMKQMKALVMRNNSVEILMKDKSYSGL